MNGQIKHSTIEELTMESIRSVYFLGIGGIGMSALARYFIKMGKQVSGYDKTETALTVKLKEEGMEIHYEDDLKYINKQADLVVYTPAIPATHSGLNYYKTHNFLLVKRSEVLGFITRSCFNICVAGTHGKTTTSSMIAHILRHSGHGCTAFLGGVTANYETNFWWSETKVAVAEADEYDRSFLQLSPNIAVITAMDADHLDIYGSAKNLEDAFIEFSGRIRNDGMLVCKEGLHRANELKGKKRITYDLHNNNADAYALNIKNNSGSYLFDARIGSKTISNIKLNMGGLHNIENALAAIVVAHRMKLTDDQIIAAISDFKGVKRRFEYVRNDEQHVMIDDYAHHPEELKALITSAKELFPGKKCVLVFQPHLFSRTKDFADGFAEALSLADEVILLPIYPARELPMPGVNSEMIAEKMKGNLVNVLPKNELIATIKSINPALLITAGAGDIDRLVPEMAAVLS